MWGFPFVNPVFFKLQCALECPGRLVENTGCWTLLRRVSASAVRSVAWSFSLLTSPHMLLLLLLTQDHPRRPTVAAQAPRVVWAPSPAQHTRRVLPLCPGTPRRSSWVGNILHSRGLQDPGPHFHHLASIWGVSFASEQWFSTFTSPIERQWEDYPQNVLGNLRGLSYFIFLGFYLFK